jgi:hypothetical protein
LQLNDLQGAARILRAAPLLSKGRIPMKDNIDRREQINVLTMQIAINKMLPDELRCDDAIAEMEQQLNRLQGRHLTAVKS